MDRRTFFRRTVGALATAAIAPRLLAAPESICYGADWGAGESESVVGFIIDLPDEITSLVPWRDRLLITTRRGLYQLTGDGPRDYQIALLQYGEVDSFNPAALLDVVTA